MRTTDTVAYPTVKEVCELFDVTVLADIHEPAQGAHIAPCPKVDGDGYGVGAEEIECTCRPIQCYAIGWNGEPDAGIRYGTVTNFFDSMNELEAFCERNIERFRQAAKDDEAVIPDASDWS